MKKASILLCSFLVISVFNLEAQEKDKVVHLKAYGSSYYLSADEGEGELVEAKKTDSPWSKEIFTLEFVREENYELHYHIKTFTNYYLTVDDDGELVLGTQEKPDDVFVFYEQFDNTYHVRYKGEQGMKINNDGEISMEGSNVTFIAIEEVEEGGQIQSQLLERPRDYEYRIRVFTSEGVFTETSSTIDIEVFYNEKTTSRSSSISSSRKVGSGNIGRRGNQEASTSFTISAYSCYITKVVISNKGGGLNDTWKVDWFQIDEKRDGQWQKIERGLMGYWVNKGEKMTLSL